MSTFRLHKNNQNLLCEHTLNCFRAETKQPNVVFILADDVGWADVPWNNNKLRSVFLTD